MLKRVLTAIFIIACVIPPLLFGGILLDILVALIITVGSYELLSLNKRYNKWNKLLVILFILLTTISVLLPISYREVIIGIMVLGILSIPIFSNNFNSEDSLFVLGILILFTMIGSAFQFIYKFNPLLIWYIIIATYLTDTGAYFVGYFFGKHKLIPNISPKKTVEGAIGGFACGFISSLIFAYFAFDGISPLIVVTSLLMPIISEIGDLAFSAIKRHFGVKDFSNIFPGHGGFMDRIDSLVFNLLFFYIILLINLLPSIQVAEVFKLWKKSFY